MNGNKPLFHPDLNLGQLGVILAVIGGFAANAYYGGNLADVQARFAKQAEFNARFDAALQVGQQRLTAVEALQAQQRQDFKEFAGEMRQGFTNLGTQIGDLKSKGIK